MIKNEINRRARKVMRTAVVKKSQVLLKHLSENGGGILPVIFDKKPLLWVSRSAYQTYNVDASIEQDVLYNEKGKVASRSCLLGFLTKLPELLKKNPNGFIYLSVGAYVREEKEEKLGLRESVFPQLEIEVISRNISNEKTLDYLNFILVWLGIEKRVIFRSYRDKSGTFERKFSLEKGTTESFYSGKKLDRNWKRYLSGFEVYRLGETDAIAGGGDFTPSAKRFGLPEGFEAAGAAIGLLRI